MHEEDGEGSARGTWKAGEESARLRGAALFAHSSDAIVDIDPAGVITAFSPAAERLLGHRAGDIVGNPLGMLLSDRTPEEVATIRANLAGQQDVEPFLAKYRHPDGNVLELSLTAVPLTHPDGSPAGITVIHRDLTALHRSQAALAASEARYRTMIDSAHEGIMGLDMEQRFTFVNARIAEMFGYTVEELTGLSLGAITFPEDEH
ncbi:MAG: PAS domain S-box protein, partial [Acidimicrobiaceae bacterium]|nr:PAS domain S-box protein [Acidimicrobiaceae bacterium]